MDVSTRPRRRPRSCDRRTDATTSQTVGPYLHIGLAPRNCTDIAFDGRTDQPARIVVEGLRRRRRRRRRCPTA